MITLKDLEEHGFERKSTFGCSIRSEDGAERKAKEHVMIDENGVRIVLFIAEGEAFAREIGHESLWEICQK